MLNVFGQRGRDAVRIDGVVVEAFGLEKDLVAAALLEAHDLVLDRGTVARADALDGAGVHRRAGEVALDDGVGRGIGVGDVAGDLRRRDRLGEEREGPGRAVAVLHFESVQANGAAVEAGRGAGLEPAHGEAERVEPRREPKGRGLANASGRDLALADMDEAAQEGAGGEDHGAGREAPPVAGDDAGDGAVLDDEVLDRGLDHLEARGRRDRRLHGLAIELAVGLGAGALHGGAFAAVQHPELDAGFVRHPAHQPVERVDLAHEMALAEAADGRIAGHFADCGKAVGDEGGPRAHPRRGRGRLAAGMAAADHDHIEALVHGPYLVGSRAFVKAATNVSRESETRRSTCRCRTRRRSRRAPPRHRSGP